MQTGHFLTKELVEVFVQIKRDRHKNRHDAIKIKFGAIKRFIDVIDTQAQSLAVLTSVPLLTSTANIGLDWKMLAGVNLSGSNMGFFFVQVTNNFQT
jgi:hypothetical protein